MHKRNICSLFFLLFPFLTLPFKGKVKKDNIRNLRSTLKVLHLKSLSAQPGKSIAVSSVSDLIVEGLICRNQQQRRQEYYWSDLYWLAWCVYCPIESSMQENLWNLLKLLLWHPFLLWVNAPDLRGRTGWGGEMCLVAGLSFARKPRKPKIPVISCS